MDNKQIKKLIEIFKKAGILKTIPRTGWVLKGIKDVESVADHTWRMGFLIMLLAPKNLDKQKLLEMNTIHDLGEIGIGDIKWESGRKVIASQKIKHKDEMKVMAEIFGSYSMGGKYVELFAEFNEQKTPEAKFLKQVDKLEMVIQALEYEERGYSKNTLDEFWENAEKYLKGESLEPIFRELQKMRR
jgi:putative hydrolase of HD superfamily